jgi:DNA-binding PadR family transcriptional regulator
MSNYLGEFEQLILFSVLHLHDDAYGVAIRESIEGRTGRAVSSGAIYTTLGRLEERGLVSSDAGPPTPGPGRPRKYYTITPPGARALMDAYTTMQAMAGGLIPQLAELADR